MGPTLLKLPMGISRCLVGVGREGTYEHAVRVLTAGMVELGWLHGSVDQLIETEAYKRFYMHGTGHYLGLDTHDVGRYKINDQWRAIEPGMVVTVEPGLYVPHGTPGVDPIFWGIGIRIEDDILVGDDGTPDNLTSAIPKEAVAIETLLRQSAGTAVV